MSEWWDNDYWVVKHPTEDRWCNTMLFAKKLCELDGYDDIIEEAVEYANNRGEESQLKKQRRAPPALAERLSKPVSRKMAFVLKKSTECLAVKRTQRAGYGGIRLLRHGGGGNGGPRYGICVRGIGPFRTLDIIVHEAAHVAHLTGAHEIRINGKRRPHDICYNRVMLKMMQRMFDLDEKWTHPLALGYSVGNGYAPSNRITKLINQMIRERDPRVMRYFDAAKPAEKKPVKPRMPTGWLKHLHGFFDYWDAYADANISDDWLHGEGVGEAVAALGLSGEDCVDAFPAIEVKLRAKQRISHRELVILDELVDECSQRFEDVGDRYWYDDPQARRYEGFINTIDKGYRWWKENIQERVDKDVLTLTGLPAHATGREED